MIQEIRKESIKCFKKAMRNNTVIVNDKTKKFNDSKQKKDIKEYNYNKSKFLSNLANALEKSSKTNFKGK